MGSLSVEASGLRTLLNTLATWKVLAWSSSSSDADTDRVRAGIDDADVVSSLRPDGSHAVVLDIDHPCYLVKSTTPGHFHLYIDVPGGIESTDYGEMLTALAKAGVIEAGYAGASLARGFSCVRLPWIKKPQGQSAA